MGSKQQGVDQRFEQIINGRARPITSTQIRTHEQWEEIACRVILLHAEWCFDLREYKGREGRPLWQDSTLQEHGRIIMGELNLIGTCESGTFVTAVRSALIRMDQRERIKYRVYRR